MRDKGFDPDDDEVTVLKIEERVIREKGKDLICPRDDKRGAAYVDTLSGTDNVGRSTHMLSYAWQYKVSSIVAALQSFCERPERKPKQTYVWICCLCINQHRVQEAQNKNPPASVPFEKFKDEFESRVTEIGHILALMVPWQAPIYLQRAWCIFEFHSALQSNKTLEVLMPPQEETNFVDSISQINGLDEMWKALGNVDVNKADASQAADKENIMKMVNKSCGADKLNCSVVRELQTWLSKRALERVLRRLETQPEDPEEEVAEACAHVAKMLRSIGKLQESEDLLRRVLKKLEGSAALTSKHGAEVSKGLGIVLWMKGHLVKALEQLKDSKKAYASFDGLYTTLGGADLLRHIGTVQRQQGKLDDAEKSFQEAQKAFEAAQGSLTCECAGLYQELGVLYATWEKKKNYKEAQKMFNLALEIHEKAGATETPDCASIYQNMGVLLRIEGELKEAREQLEKSKGIMEATGTLETPNGANLLQNFGVLESKNFEQAKEKFDRALEIFKATNATRTVSCADVYENLGDLIYLRGANGELRDALSNYEEAQNIREAIDTSWVMAKDRLEKKMAACQRTSSGPKAKGKRSRGSRGGPPSVERPAAFTMRGKSHSGTSAGDSSSLEEGSEEGSQPMDPVAQEPATGFRRPATFATRGRPRSQSSTNSGQSPGSEEDIWLAVPDYFACAAETSFDFAVSNKGSRAPDERSDVDAS